MDINLLLFFIVKTDVLHESAVSTPASKCALTVAVVVWFIQLTPVSTLVSMPVGPAVESRRLGKRDKEVRLRVSLSRKSRELFSGNCREILVSTLDKFS